MNWSMVAHFALKTRLFTMPVSDWVRERESHGMRWMTDRVGLRLKSLDIRRLVATAHHGGRAHSGIVSMRFNNMNMQAASRVGTLTDLQALKTIALVPARCRCPSERPERGRDRCCVRASPISKLQVLVGGVVRLYLLCRWPRRCSSLPESFRHSRLPHSWTGSSKGKGGGRVSAHPISPGARGPALCSRASRRPKAPIPEA